MKDEVKNYKEGRFNSEDIIGKKVTNEKKYENKQNIFHTIKVNYYKVIQLNNELKVNVDYQKVDIKHLKEQCDIDDEDKDQKTRVARTLLNSLYV